MRTHAFRLRTLLVLTLAASVVAGCGAAPFPVPGQAGVAVLRSDVDRASADAPAARRAAAAVDAFAADLYRELARTPGNVAFSPYSVAIALAMTRAGAAGTTAQEMDAVLHAAVAGDLDGTLNALDQALAKRPGKYPYGDTTVDLELAVADRVWGQRGYPFEQPYLDRLAAYYGADMRLVDYVGARAQARADINKWIAERTRDRIPELIPDGVLDELTRLVLTNAVYLKAKWQVPFAKAATAEAPFHRLDGTDTKAKLMRLSTSGLTYGSGSGYQAVRLPYVGGLSMVVIVPDRGRFAAVEGSLRDDAAIRRILDVLQRGTHVTLRLPKFTFRTKAMLKPALITLGMPVAFSDHADFSGMSPRGRELAIRDVAHETFIAVDEDGTEAAAATAVVVEATSGPLKSVELTVDRPFLFLIRDDETGATLFMGRVVDPG